MAHCTSSCGRCTEEERRCILIVVPLLDGWVKIETYEIQIICIHLRYVPIYSVTRTCIYPSIYLFASIWSINPQVSYQNVIQGEVNIFFFFNPAPFIFSPHAPSPRTLCLIHFGPATSPTFHISSQHSVRINTSIFLARVLYYQSTLPRYISPPAAFHHEQNKGWCTETVGPKQLNKVAERRGEGDGVNIPFRLSFSLSHEDLHE